MGGDIREFKDSSFLKSLKKTVFLNQFFGCFFCLKHIAFDKMSEKEEEIYIRKGRRKQELIRDAIHNSKGYKQSVLIVSSFGKTKSGIMENVSYLTPDDNTAINTRDEKKIQTEEAKELASKWIDETKKRKGANRYTMNLILQSLPKADQEKVSNAFSQFLKKEFADNDYMYSVHTNTKSPHAHVIVKMQGDKGKKIQATKPDLYKWREDFAETMRGNGFKVAATSRRSRGRLGKAQEMGSVMKASFYGEKQPESKERKYDQENIKEWTDFYKEAGESMKKSNDTNINKLGNTLIEYERSLSNQKQQTR